jgi:UDP-N-acetyl-D-mannosaminuronic acid dehydrogenase
LSSKPAISRVSVVGLGYIGLPTAAVIASHGIDVIGLDVNPTVVDTLNRGEIHIVEPDLKVLFKAAVAARKFHAVIQPEAADVFLIAVPTPFKGRHEPDLSYIESAAKSTAKVLEPGNLVILESTSPVGTTEKMSEWLSQLRPDLSFPQHAGERADVQIAYCPERVLPGKILHELVHNDRVVGGMTQHCTDRAAQFYQIFVKGKCLPTTSRTAEMAKLTENAFRDVNIAFANELSLICDRLQIDVWELIDLANHHPRVNILQPGPGVGGHCIAVDPWFIVDSTPDLARIIRTARDVNDSKPLWVIERVKQAASHFPSPTIACLGLAFKPDIDDLRESPALEITARIAKEIDGTILVVEPHIDRLPKNFNELANVRLETADRAIRHADIVVILVNHRQFYGVDLDTLIGKTLIDTRGMWR